MKMKVVLTVDTEPSVAGALEDPARYKPLIDEPVWGPVGARSEALGFMIETLTRYGQKATFFVETAHASYFGDAPMGRYVEKLSAAGQDVQLHVHPCWTAFTQEGPDLTRPLTDQCSDLATERLTGLINEGADRIKAWTGQRATGMRTGNFATSRGVFTAMRDAGLRHSSNICIGVAPPEEPDLQLAGGVHVIESICELPVTCFRDMGPAGRGRWRPMQITALSAGELTSLLDKMQHQGAEVAMIVTHPFEFIKRKNFRYEGLRANGIVQRRLEALCRFLSANDDRFEVVALSDAARPSPAAQDPEPLAGSAWRGTLRAAENFLNDRFL